MRRLAWVLLAAGTCAAGPGDGKEPSGAPAPVVSEAGPRVVGYTIAGRLFEPEKKLRAFLDPRILQIEWSAAARKDLSEWLGDKLAYRAKWDTRTSAQGVWLTLTLTRASRVRYVEIDGNWPILAADVRARLKLRRGQPLPDTEDARTKVLDIDEQRTMDFLRDEGYLDARVDIRADQKPGSHAVTIEVELLKGPQYDIGTIHVSGNTVFSARDIDSVFRRGKYFGLLREGFSVELVKNAGTDLEKKYQDAGYPAARVQATYDFSEREPNNNTQPLHVVVQEGKRVDVTFEGNRHIQNLRLRQELTFAREQNYDSYEEESSADAIRRKYETEGYFQAVVTSERQRFPGYEAIIFRIDEGPRLPVSDVRMTGNRKVTSDELRAVVNTKRLAGWLTRSFTQGGYVTRLLLEQDARAIEDVYRERGFAQVVVKARVAPRRELLAQSGALAAAAAAEFPAGGLVVEFAIDEGPQSIVDKVQLVGNNVLTDADIEEALKLHKDSPFTQPALEADAEAIKRLYLDRGFKDVQVTTKVAGEARKAVLHTISEGAPIRWGEVLVRGNFRTKDWVIRENLAFQPGTLYSFSELAESKFRLHLSSLFTAPRFESVVDPGVVHTIVNVEEAEDRLGTIKLEAGFATDQLVFGGAEISARNLLGTGAQFHADGEAGLDRRFANVGFSFPQFWMDHFVSVPLKFDVTGSVLRDQHERFGVLRSYELGATLGRRLSLNTQFGFGYRFRQFDRQEELVRPAGASGSIEKDSVRTTSALIGPAFSYDQRRDDDGNKNPILPTQGFLLNLSLQWASRYLGGDAEFVKFSSSGTFFIPIGKRILLQSKLRYDQGFPLGGAVMLPEVERFFGGGDSDFRGIESDRLHTEIIRAPLYPGGPAESFRVVPAGGNIRALATVDLEFRVWDHSFLAGWPLASAVFLDNGLITNSLDPDAFGIRDVRHSLGLGLRLVTPLGKFSFEWAVPLDPQLGDDPRGRLHFNIGFGF